MLMKGESHMKKTDSATEYLRVSPLKALCTICLPLILVNVVLLFTTTITNTLYSRCAGQVYFTVTGYISTATTLYSNIVGSVYIGGWVKIAPDFARSGKTAATRSLQSALLAMAIAVAGVGVLFLLFTYPVLQALHVPEEIYGDARLYYSLYFASYLPASLAAFFLTTVNGIGSGKRIFWVNILVILTNLLGAWMLLDVLRLKFVGAALCGALGALMQLAFYFVLFRRDGYFHTGFSPDWQLVFSILHRSVPIAVQSILCTLGYLMVTLQTNRLLTSEYITVLNVSLPLTGVLSAVGSAILAFCPQNFSGGKPERLRQFLRLAVCCSMVYGMLCFLVYALLGTWYYGRLFTDGQIVALGSRFWFWQGIGYLFLALIYPIRYFFDSVGMSRLSLLSGVGELIGNGICAAFLIPQFGNIGRSLAYPLGWALACCLLLGAYFVNRRKIFESCKGQKESGAGS